MVGRIALGISRRIGVGITALLALSLGILRRIGRVARERLDACVYD